MARIAFVSDAVWMVFHALVKDANFLVILSLSTKFAPDFDFILAFSSAR